VQNRESPRQRGVCELVQKRKNSAGRQAKKAGDSVYPRKQQTKSKVTSGEGALTKKKKKVALNGNRIGQLKKEVNIEQGARVKKEEQCSTPLGTTNDKSNFACRGAGSISLFEKKRN